MDISKASKYFESTMAQAFNKAGISNSGEVVVMAVSGGSDSLAMLFAASRLKKRLGFELHGAHLNHRLRGDDSEKDADFVASTFQSLGIEFTLGSKDVGILKMTGDMSLEEAAREARYSFLSGVVNRQNAIAVAVGHTSDDQAETVMMNIVRGAGLVGLRGMEAVTRRNIAGKEVVIVRPILKLTKSDVLQYCDDFGIGSRLDKSNLSKDLTRNWIRMEVLPLIKTHNPLISESLVRLSRNVSKQLGWIDKCVDNEWKRLGKNEKGKGILDKQGFLQLDPALQVNLLRYTIATVMGDLKGITQRHLNRMTGLINGSAGRTIDLPRGMKVLVDYRQIIVFRGEVNSYSPIEGVHELKMPGETKIGDLRISASIVEKEALKDPAREFLAERSLDYCRQFDKPKVYLSHSAVAGKVYVRSRRPGDRFQPKGMCGHKKLQDFMVDAKIPKHLRDKVPILLSQERVAAVVGWRTADWATVKTNDARIVELLFVRDDLK